MPFDMMGVEWSRKVAFAGIDVTGHQAWIIFLTTSKTMELCFVGSLCKVKIEVFLSSKVIFENNEVCTWKIEMNKSFDRIFLSKEGKGKRNVWC